MKRLFYGFKTNGRKCSDNQANRLGRRFCFLGDEEHTSLLGVIPPINSFDWKDRATSTRAHRECGFLPQELWGLRRQNVYGKIHIKTHSFLDYDKLHMGFRFVHIQFVQMNSILSSPEE